MEGKRQGTDNTILKNKVQGQTLPNFKTQYKVTIIKSMQYWWKSNQIDQWNRIKGLEIDSYNCSQLIFDKPTKAVEWRKDSLFNKWYWDKWTSTCNKKKESRQLSLHC